MKQAKSGSWLERFLAFACRPAAEQVQMPVEAIFHVAMDVGQDANLASGDRTAVAQFGVVLRDQSFEFQQHVMDQLQAGVQSVALDVFGDAPEPAGVGEGK